MIKVIILDYDGVIVDSFPNCYKAYKVICGELGKDFPKTFEEFKKIYGYNSIECYQNLGIPEEDYSKAGKIYKREILKLKSPLFKGIKEVIEKLNKKYHLVVISSSYTEEVENKLDLYGIRDFFNTIVGNKIHDKHYNKTKAIREFLDKNNLSPSEVISIGDRDVDYNEGKKAGLRNILLVDYGWGYSNKVPKPKYTIKKPQDILKTINNFL